MLLMLNLPYWVFEEVCEEYVSTSVACLVRTQCVNIGIRRNCRIVRAVYLGLPAVESVCVLIECEAV